MRTWVQLCGSAAATDVAATVDMPHAAASIRENRKVLHFFMASSGVDQSCRDRLRSRCDAWEARHRFQRVEFDVIAHVALARIGKRLPVPRLDPALCGRFKMKAPAALAGEHVLMQRGKTPSARHFLAECRK